MPRGSWLLQVVVPNLVLSCCCKNYEATSGRQNLFSENYVLFIVLDLLAYLPGRSIAAYIPCVLHAGSFSSFAPIGLRLSLSQSLAPDRKYRESISYSCYHVRIH